MQHITKEGIFSIIKNSNFKILKCYDLKEPVITSYGYITISYFYFLENDIRILVNETSEYKSIFSYNIEDFKSIYNVIFKKLHRNHKS